MKRGGTGSGILVTSFAVAQTVVASYYSEMQQCQVAEKEDNGVNGKNEKHEDLRFTPRIDGLRFIETLVTAHR